MGWEGVEEGIKPLAGSVRRVRQSQSQGGVCDKGSARASHSSIGKRCVGVFDVSQAVVRTHGSVVGRSFGLYFAACRVKNGSWEAMLQRAADVENTLIQMCEAEWIR